MLVCLFYRTRKPKEVEAELSIDCLWAGSASWLCELFPRHLCQHSGCALFYAVVEFLSGYFSLYILELILMEMLHSASKKVLKNLTRE